MRRITAGGCALSGTPSSRPPSRVTCSCSRGWTSRRSCGGSSSNREVDFVVKTGRTLTAIEVKGGWPAEALPGIAAFAEVFKPKRTLLVGAGGIPVEEFLMQPVTH